MSELYHYGRSKRDGAKVGSGRYPLGSSKNDKLIKNKVVFSRYSSTKEKDIRSGSYFFNSNSQNDREVYLDDFTKNNLTGKYSRNLYKINMSNIRPITVRSGQETVADVMSKIKDKNVHDSYELLKKAGFFEPWSDANYRYNRIGNDDKLFYTDRMKVAKAIHDYVYKNRKNIADEYKKAGYDAVVDPEDFTYIYDMPLIITDPSAFKITSSKKQ